MAEGVLDPAAVVGDDCAIEDIEPPLLERRGHSAARGVVANALGHPVTDGDHRRGVPRRLARLVIVPVIVLVTGHGIPIVPTTTHNLSHTL